MRSNRRTDIASGFGSHTGVNDTLTFATSPAPWKQTHRGIIRGRKKLL